MQYTTPENKNDIVTQMAVHLLASFVFIKCGVLLNMPKSRARKIKIEVINNIQTVIIKVNLVYVVIAKILIGVELM